MSIIYEALKKVEKKEGELLPAQGNAIIKRKRKLKPILLISTAAVVISLLILGMYVSYWKSKPIKVAVYLDNLRSFLGVLGDKNKKVVSLNKKNIFQRKSPLRKDIGGNQEDRKYYLQGIVYTEEAPLALIIVKQVALGESIDEATVVSISKKGVELETKEGKISLVLEQ